MMNFPIYMGKGSYGESVHIQGDLPYMGEKPYILGKNSSGNICLI